MCGITLEQKLDLVCTAKYIKNCSEKIAESLRVKIWITILPAQGVSGELSWYANYSRKNQKSNCFNRIYRSRNIYNSSTLITISWLHTWCTKIVFHMVDVYK
jgi:hypothetical protein